MNKFVIDILADDFERNRKSACTYCGDTTSLTRDHVIAVSWTGFKRSYEKGSTVPACRECNSILGANPFFSICSRANFISNQLTRKYRKILNHPHWSDSELEQMSREFQSSLKSRGNAKSFIEARIRHAALMSLDENDLIRVKQATNDNNVLYTILGELYRGKSYEKVSKKFGIEIAMLKRIFLLKKNFKILNLFMWEHQIEFDAKIYKLIKIKQTSKKAVIKKYKTKISEGLENAVLQGM